MRSLVIFLTVGALVLAGCGSPSPTGSRPAASQPAAGSPQAAGQPGTTTHSPEVQRLIAAAKDAGENELTFIWSGSTLGGAEGAQRFERLFNQMYGTDVRMNFVPGPSMANMAAQVSQEVTTGRRTSTDVLMGAESHFGGLLDRDVLESYDYTALSPRIVPEIVAPNNIAVEIASRFPGITYNTDLIPRAEVPRRLEDTLNPKWRGRIASTPNASSFDRVAVRPEWGVEKMRVFVTQLSQNIAGLMRCGETTRLLSGEFTMLVMDCGSFEANKQREAGAPIGHVIPEDAATALFFYMGVPRTSSHPNLAKLYINMLLSEEGQRLMYEMEGNDHYGLPGSRSAAELSEIRAKGVEPLRFDARRMAENPELNRFGDELATILREKR